MPTTQQVKYLSLTIAIALIAKLQDAEFQW